jgi:predicted phage terminase large subunit-like protein
LFLLAHIPQFGIDISSYWFFSRRQQVLPIEMPVKPELLGFAKSILAEKAQILARHHRLLLDRLQDVADGRCNRLMIQMPPGSAKSTFGSVIFPAYFLGRHVGSQVIATAHTASLAHHFGRGVRSVICEHGERLGLTLSKTSKAAGEFSLEEGGAYFAAGVRGPITGRRADLILIDDPIKSWAEAESPTYRDALYDWYRGELSARLKPKGRVVFIMTRWHEDDLAGRLLAGGGDWETLRLPALAEPGDPLGREIGEALWPEWQDAESINKLRGEVGERSFSAMYQQQPRPSDSSLFDVTKIAYVTECPIPIRMVRAWDLAATAASSGRDPDYTVGVKLGVTSNTHIGVLDVIRMRGSAGDVAAKIVETARRDGRQTRVGLPRDPGQAGIAQVDYLQTQLDGYNSDASPETGSKVVRAMPAAAQIDQGRVSLLVAPWNEAFIRELEAFPESRKDDQVDAFSRAMSMIVAPSPIGARVRKVPMFER